MNADQIAVIDKGRIVEKGTHSELVEREGGIYRALVHRQMNRETSQSQHSSTAKGKETSVGRKGAGGGKSGGRGGSGTAGGTTTTAGKTDIDELFDAAEE